MGKIQPDFTQAVQFGATVPGMYKLQVQGSEVEVSKEKQTPMVNWKFVTTEVIKGGDQSELGRTLWRRTPLSGKGAGFLEELLKALGRDDLVENQGAAWDTEEMHGQFVGAEVDNRAYKDASTGEDRVAPDIKRFFRIR